jgi:hypothetical protein
MGFEPTISVLERAKTVRALDRAATAIGIMVDGIKIWNPHVVQSEQHCLIACDAS